MDTISIPLKVKVEFGPDALKLLAALFSSISAGQVNGPTTSKGRLQSLLADQSSSVLLVDTKEAAAMLKVCEKTLWNLHTTGRMPKPIRIGGAVRWSYDELRAWVAAGCPTMGRWKHEPI